MTNVSVRRIAIALVGILAAAASSAGAQTPEDSWVLAKGEGIAVGKDNPASLRLDDKQMSGSTGCNTFRAKIDNRPDNRVAISDVALTRKMCAPKVSEVERAIVEAFGKTEFMQREPRTLTFLSGKKEPLLVWKAAEKAAAADKSLRAGMLPPGKTRTAAVLEKRTAKPNVMKAKSTRKVHLARGVKTHKRITHVSRKHVARKRIAHGRAKKWRVAQVPRRCRCHCSWWD